MVLHYFTNALLGGLLIGAAVSLMVVFLGRITGISGIVAFSLTGLPQETCWRRAFIFGLIAAPVLWRLLLGPLPEIAIDASMSRLILAGILVGFGTRLGSGCTSGHGVCGIARLSKRSLLATVLFMISAMMMVWLFPV